MADRAVVRDSSDREQIARATRKARDREAQFLTALATCLQHAAFRFVFACWSEDAGLFETSFDHSGSVMYFKEGHRNHGLKQLKDCERADPEALDLLLRERRQRVTRETRETEATHTKRVDPTADPEAEPDAVN